VILNLMDVRYTSATRSYIFKGASSPIGVLIFVIVIETESCGFSEAPENLLLGV
jgi:hypothetical protein